MSSRANTQATERGKSGSKMPPAPRSTPKKKPTASAQRDEPQTNTTGNTLPARHQLVEQAAYFIAERRGFAPGNELDDWLQAEAEVVARTTRALQ